MEMEMTVGKKKLHGELESPRKRKERLGKKEWMEDGLREIDSGSFENGEPYQGHAHEPFRELSLVE